MKITFIHQNFPGQYKHLARALASDPSNRVVFISRRSDRDIPGVRRLTYGLRRTGNPQTHPYLRSAENAVLHGQDVARVLLSMSKEGFVPDVIVGHPGWGETLFVKDVLPDVPYLNYCEFYYRTQGQDFGFDPIYPCSLDTKLSLRTRNTPLLLALESCDRGIAPTEWQRSTHPEALQSKIETIHDGVDTAALCPDPMARFTLPDGRVLVPGDPVITYAARNLEPYRGFPSFLRAVPHILDARPDATILIIGGDETSYGARPRDGGNWRESMLKEVPVDLTRVIFLGHLPYDRFLAAIGVSQVHVYLTYPFVLSWSMLEVMALGRVVVGSDTAPVREIIRHGENGLLADFFAPEAIANRVLDVLTDPAAFAPLGHAARQTVLDRYALPDCLTRQTRLIRDMANR
ncbi:glycosyltransferase family 4 protein [Azospirillum sp. YIM DDC1]|uniref:Glycosyltransferase family 4 protein n=1 Tax=Azospirillum aestuarii TaxID=2802052 RepID=A0ABS1I8N9_9PROT|nr:glycosyltransferase family 4 protein [Azospirillum aestuarii]MBK4723434.1 glycosyltransferase family 4 protein [Azospirillum aestuarii]